MGSIETYKKRDGSESYYAEVTRKGFATVRRCFSKKSTAERWIAHVEKKIFAIRERENT